MAVYAPGDNPRDYPGVDPGMWARLMGYLNPIGSANAAETPQGPEAGHPTNAAGQPLYAFPHIREALASGAGNTNTPAILPHLSSDGPNVQGRPILPYLNPNTAALANAASIPTDLPPTGPAAPSRPSGIGSDANFPVLGAGGFPTTYAPPGQQPAMPTPMAPPGRAPAKVGGNGAHIPPNAVGIAPGAAAPPVHNPFATLDYRPNANPGTGAGMLGGALASPRGQGGAPISTALDLSGLFGGGGQSAAAPALRKKINVGKIPPDMRAEAPPRKPGPQDPSIIARQRMRRSKASTSSQSGGY